MFESEGAKGALLCVSVSLLSGAAAKVLSMYGVHWEQQKWPRLARDDERKRRGGTAFCMPRRGATTEAAEVVLALQGC